MFLGSISAIAWGFVAMFGINPVDWLVSNSTTSALNRIILSIIALAGLWCIKLLFNKREIVEIEKKHNRR